MHPHKTELRTEWPGMEVASGSASATSASSYSAAATSATRWLLVSDDVVSADWLASELRRAGDVVRLVDAGGLELSRLGAFDAQVLLACQGQELRFLRERLTMHPGLRWLEALFVSYPDPWQEEGASFIRQLQASAVTLTCADRELESLARKPPRSFAAPIDRIGPVRLLRALCGAEDVFRVRFASATHEASVDVAGSLVLGAVFERGGEPTLVGAEALAGVLELAEGRATVEHRPSLHAPLLSLSIDRALERAYAEVRERRLNRDADSPTLRIRSPLSRSPREGPSPYSAAVGAEDVPARSTFESSADTKLLEVAPELLYYTPSVSGVVARPDPAPSTPMAEPLLSRALADTHEIVMPRTLMARAYLRLALLSALLALATFGVARLAGFPRAQPDARGNSKVSTGPNGTSTPAASQAAIVPPSGPQASPDLQKQARAPMPSPVPAPIPVEGSAPSRVEASVSESMSARSGDTAGTQEAEQTGAPARESAQALISGAARALQAGDAKTAAELAKRALSLRPRRVTYLVLYGDALAAAGDRGAALEQFRLALARQPRSRALERRIEALERAEATR